ncbi:MAG: SDR family NAD(P)-dependent oxidoreductase [Geodermatophilaceae bacterium]
MTSDAQTAPVRTALITGGSRGLGRALTKELLESGWRVVTNGRDGQALLRLRTEVRNPDALIAVTGDVGRPEHRAALISEVASVGGLDLLVNNASVLGPSPQPALADYPIDTLRAVYDVNLFAPLALIQFALPYLQARTGRIINVSSDAAVEPYEGWGGYGSAKAALDQITNVLSAEHPGLRIYSFDPGDMRTDMHARAFPGEDISDRPEPETVIPALLQLIEAGLPSGRYRASVLLPQVTT